MIRHRYRNGKYWANLGAALALSAVGAGVWAQAYPTKPVRLIAPFPAGGSSALVARIVGQKFSETFGQQIVIDNRPGAGSNLGIQIAARAAADGYTLMIRSVTTTINTALYKNPGFALKDFTPIARLAIGPTALVVHLAVSAKSVSELTALTKARPAAIRYAAAGHGTLPHLTMELFATMARIRLVNVPYKGGAPGIIDLLGGRIEATATSSMSVILPHVRSGRLRALGVTTAKRTLALLELPTIAEAGLPGYEALQWAGLLAPAGTPQEIVVKVYQETAGILRKPEAVPYLARDGNELVASSPEEFAAFIKTEIAKWANVVKAAGIQPE